MEYEEIYVRGYYRYHKDKYSTEYDDIHLIFGMVLCDYSGDLITKKSISVKWYLIEDKLYAKLEIFQDALSALTLYSDVFDILSKKESEYITEEEFVELLNNCGFKDMTCYE